MSTAPFSADLPGYLTTTLTHVVRAEVAVDMAETRRNLSVVPTAVGSGWTTNNTYWTRTLGNATTGHPTGVTTTATVTVASSSAGAQLASLNSIDGLGDSAVVRGAGVWVKPPVDANVEVYLDNDSAGTRGNTAAPANTWTFCPSDGSGTGYVIVIANTANAANATVGAITYMTGSIIEAAKVPESYFDGSSVAEGAKYSWTGTAYASASIEKKPTLLPLEVEDATISWDEKRSPRVQASLTCKVPDAQETLDRIDPRTGARLWVTMGYVLPGGREESHLMADLTLRSRVVSRPDDTMAIEGLSDEALLIDATDTATGNISNATTTGAITSVINQIITTVPTVVGTTGPAVSSTLFEDRWTCINDLADRIEAQVYDDGLRNWYITSVPGLTAASHFLTVGEDGTIISSEAGMTRDDGWANYVWLRYEWDVAGVANLRQSQRRITSGPMAAVAGNYKIVKVVREGLSATQTEADAAATALVKRMSTRGRTFSVEAIAAYWLRPGDTIDVQLPLGGIESHIISAITFSPVEGTMQIDTRLPDGTMTYGA